MAMSPKLKRQRFTNVWDALEDDPAAAANMTMRSDLMIALQRRIADWQMTQTQAARRLAITQPRLNDLLRGRINKFSLDTLVDMLGHAGIDVEVSTVSAEAQSTSPSPSGWAVPASTWSGTFAFEAPENEDATVVAANTQLAVAA